MGELLFSHKYSQMSESKFFQNSMPENVCIVCGTNHNWFSDSYPD